MKKINIAVDGACRNNQQRKNLGAWAFVVEVDGNIEYEDADIEANTTNNKMELTAFLRAIEYICGCNVKKSTILIDSSYVYNSIEKGWVYNWEKLDFKYKNELRPNTDLWKLVLEKLREVKLKGYTVELKKVNGHSDNELNNRVDLLCNLEMNKYQEV